MRTGDRKPTDRGHQGKRKFVNAIGARKASGYYIKRGRTADTGQKQCYIPARLDAISAEGIPIIKPPERKAEACYKTRTFNFA